MGSVPPKNIFSLRSRGAHGPCLANAICQFLIFLMKTARQIFIILYASYAWDTCLFRISFADYAIQTVRYDIIYMS